MLAFVSLVKAQEESPPVFQGHRTGYWIDALRSDDIATRRRAVYALWQLGPLPADGERPVARALRDRDEYVRDTAQRLIARQSKTSSLKTVLPELLAALKDERREVRLKVAPLFHLPKPLSTAAAQEIVAGLGPDDPEISTALVGALATQAGRSREVADVLRKALATAALPKRGWIAISLSGADLEAAVPALIDALDKGGSALKVQIAKAVMEQRKKPKPLELALVRRLQDKHVDVRLWSARVLAYKWCPGEAVPDATRLLANETATDLRVAAAHCLGKVRENKEAAVPPLVAAIGDPDPQVRYAATLAVGWLDDKGLPAVAALVAIAGDANADANLRCAAAVSLWRIGSGEEKVIRAFRDMLSDGNARVRRAAADALSVLATHAKPAVPELTAALRRSPDSTEMSSLCRALGRIGRAAVPAEDALAHVLKTATDLPRVAAAFAICRIHENESKPHPALDVIIAALKNSEFPTKFMALRFLEWMGPSASPAVPALVGLLAAENPNLTPAAMRALGQIGGAAKAALPVLRKIAKETTDARTRKTAEAALAAIEGK